MAGLPFECLGRFRTRAGTLPPQPTLTCARQHRTSGPIETTRCRRHAPRFQPGRLQAPASRCGSLPAGPGSRSARVPHVHAHRSGAAGCARAARDRRGSPARQQLASRASRSTRRQDHRRWIGRNALDPNAHDPVAFNEVTKTSRPSGEL